MPSLRPFDPLFRLSFDCSASSGLEHASPGIQPNDSSFGQLEEGTRTWKQAGAEKAVAFSWCGGFLAAGFVAGVHQAAIRRFTPDADVQNLPPRETLEAAASVN